MTNLTSVTSVEDLKNRLHPETLLQLNGVDVDDYPDETDADYENLDKLYNTCDLLPVLKWIYEVGNEKDFSSKY